MDMEQCLEWYEEDHNEAFNFTSEFAEDLAREKRPNRNEQIKNHKKIVAEQQRKDDLLIKHSNRLLEAAERQKAHFRKTVTRLEQELQDVYNDWEASEISNREEMDKIKSELEKEKKKNTEKNNIRSEVKELEQKCKECKFTSKDSNTLSNHVALVHSIQDCNFCEKRLKCKAALRNHVKNHLMNTPEIFCDVCKKKFNKIEDARVHAKTPCGKVSEDSIEFDCIK